MADMEAVGTELTEVTDDGMSVTSNSETEEEMKENFASEEKPLDGDPKEAEKKKRSKAAAELGKAGGEASAKARAEAAESTEDEELVEVGAEEEEAPEAKEDESEEDETEAAAPPEKKGNPRHDARARVMEATRQLKEERERREALEARLAAIEAKEAPVKAPPVNEKPTPEAFPTYEEYVEALTEWKAEEILKKRERASAEEAAKQRHVDMVQSKVGLFNERLAEARQSDPELLERIDPDLLGLQPTFLLPPGTRPGPENDIAQAILESEHTSALLLHLSAHPEEMVRLSGLPDSFAVARAMGVLEAKVTGEVPAPRPGLKPTPAPTYSQAKPPVRPVNGSPQYSEEEVTDDMDLDTHIRILNTRDARARRGR